MQLFVALVMAWLGFYWSDSWYVFVLWELPAALLVCGFALCNGSLASAVMSVGASVRPVVSEEAEAAPEPVSSSAEVVSLDGFRDRREASEGAAGPADAVS